MRAIKIHNSTMQHILQRFYKKRRERETIKNFFEVKCVKISIFLTKISLAHLSKKKLFSFFFSSLFMYGTLFGQRN